MRAPFVRSPSAARSAYATRMRAPYMLHAPRACIQSTHICVVLYVCVAVWPVHAWALPVTLHCYTDADDTADHAAVLMMLVAVMQCWLRAVARTQEHQ